MAIYEYQCTECKGITERVQSMHDRREETISCGFCGQTANFKISAVAVMRSGMSNTPIDVAVGRASDAQWASIEKRQAERNRIRRESQRQGLTASDYRTFAPIGSEQIAQRTRALDYVARDGHKPDTSDALTRLAEGTRPS